ncbi:MAG: acyl-CoA dehydrogenase family protein, partial [candidate division WOR-3 bacterium]
MEEIPLSEFRQYVAEVAEREIAPHAAEADRTETFPLKSWRALANNDLLGVNAPPEFGGMGLSNQHYATMIEEITRADPAVAVTAAVHTGLVIYMIDTFGNPEQKSKYLPGLIKGDLLGAFSLSEPNAGSDAGAIRTTARETPDGFILNGSKIFCTSGNIADIIITFAVTDPDLGKKGISAFLIDKNTPGFSVPRLEHKLGWRGSPLAQLAFDEAPIPKENMLGERGAGMKLAFTALDTGRVGMAAMGTGIIAEALHLSSEYAKERKQFGQPIGSFGAVADMIVGMAVNHEAARMLTLNAARLKDEGKRFTKEASIAKLFATEAAMRAAIDCIQVFGGYGYTTEYKPERLFRDAKALSIVEGTNQIQKIVIAR